MIPLHRSQQAAAVAVAMLTVLSLDYVSRFFVPTGSSKAERPRLSL